MQRIIPGMEFVKGIPENIEDEQFLNPIIQNRIVIDDLMSEASNDKRICDLFIKGSHHRNLSVICLVQNLYYQGKESRTMSLNSQYLVVFNNPWAGLSKFLATVANETKILLATVKIN